MTTSFLINSIKYKIMFLFFGGKLKMISLTKGTYSSYLIPCNAIILLYIAYGTIGWSSFVNIFLMTPATAYPQ